MTVDEELYYIIMWMKKDKNVSKAIRRYAKAYIGEENLKKIFK